MTEDELRDVINTIIGEAVGEGPEGMAAVAWAIKNRAEARGMSMAEVVRQRNQFDGFSKPGSYAVRAQQDPAVRRSVQDMLDQVVTGALPDPTGGADHFISGNIETNWTREYPHTTTIGGHRFYSSPQAAARYSNPPRRVEPSMPTPMDPAIAISRQLNSGQRTAPDSNFYDGLFPAPPMPQSSTPPFRPFSSGERVENADGSFSTERTITWQTPDGQWVNTPTLFQTANGVLDLSDPSRENEARNAASVLMRSGQSFPTFQTLPEAERAATARSNGGGAGSRPPITDRDLIRSSGISDTVRNTQAQQDPALAAALQSRIASAQSSSAPPMPKSVAQSPIRREPPEPRIAPPMPPAAPRVQTAQVPAGMPTNMRSRDSAAHAASGKATVASFQAPPIPSPNAPAKSEDRLVAGVYPKPPMPIPNVAAAPGLSVVPDVGVASLLDTMPPMPVSGFPTSLALRPGAATSMVPRPPMPGQRAVTGFPTSLAQRPASRQPLNVTVRGAGSYSGSSESRSNGSSAEPRYVMAATGKEVKPVQTQIYNPDTNQFENRTVYR